MKLLYFYLFPYIRLPTTDSLFGTFYLPRFLYVWLTVSLCLRSVKRNRPHRGEGESAVYSQQVSRLSRLSLWKYVMSCHVMSCHVMLCHVMSCHVMLTHQVLPSPNQLLLPQHQHHQHWYQYRPQCYLSPHHPNMFVTPPLQ